ncbi:MAG: dTDP-4-dehydrorhamnose reductase [Bacteroidales bacterium]|nr:dTDP-4-dehydrorhamnose reductase [Bacteroidales bacterium]
MKILVTGSNGQLGNEMRVLASNDAANDYLFTDVNQVEGLETLYLDICDALALRDLLIAEKVDVIVNCAAYTNVDAAESNELLAEKLNAEAPENLAKAAAAVGALLIHVSTDYVFGAEPYNKPCREDQQGTPTGVYGLTKLHGEERIKAVGGDFVIIRTAWLYSEYGKNFCKTMMQLTASKPQLKVVFDQVGTPTYALDLARAIVTIIADYEQERAASLTLGPPAATPAASLSATQPAASEAAAHAYSKRGMYQYSNEGVCSWYDFAKMIQQTALQLAFPDAQQMAQCDIRPCHSEEFPSPVKRPNYSVLDKTKIKETFGLQIPYWTDSLKMCIENSKNLGQ